MRRAHGCATRGAASAQTRKHCRQQLNHARGLVGNRPHARGRLPAGWYVCNPRLPERCSAAAARASAPHQAVAVMPWERGSLQETESHEAYCSQHRIEPQPARLTGRLRSELAHHRTLASCPVSTRSVLTLSAAADQRLGCPSRQSCPAPPCRGSPPSPSSDPPGRPSPHPWGQEGVNRRLVII